MERAQKAFRDIALGPVGLDFREVDKQCRIGLARGQKQVGKAVAGKLHRLAQRLGCIAEHSIRTALPIRIVVSAINTRDTLVARACAGADREIDPVGVAAHRRRCAGKPVILRQEECLPGLDRRPYRRLAPLLRVHREIMDRRLIAQACIEAQQISVEEAQNLTEQREISLFHRPPG